MTEREWKVGQRVEVRCPDDDGWRVGVVCAKAPRSETGFFAGRYRVADRQGDDMRWSVWVKPEDMVDPDEPLRHDLWLSGYGYVTFDCEMGQVDVCAASDQTSYERSAVMSAEQLDGLIATLQRMRGRL